MEIIVCVKRIPDTAEVVDVVEIDASGKDIKKDALIYKINNWDEYVLEEAIELKEKYGGKVTAVTVGPESCNQVLWTAYAMGVDEAVRIDENVDAADSYVVAKLLTALIGRQSYDAVLFGMQSEDLGRGSLGVMCAEMLGIPHAAGVFSIETQDGVIKVGRELEAGILEIYNLKLPALLTIQTGINNPRYVPLIKIKRAQSKELKVVTPEDLGLPRDTLSPMVKLEKFEYPPVGKMAEIISGSAEEAAAKLTTILKGQALL